jgi:hypothetical protein
MFYFRHSVPSSVLRILTHGSIHAQCTRLETAGFSPLVIRGVMLPHIIISEHKTYYSRSHPPRFEAKYAVGADGLITLDDDELADFWHMNVYGVAGHKFRLPHTIRAKSVLVY